MREMRGGGREWIEGGSGVLDCSTKMRVIHPDVCDSFYSTIARKVKQRMG